MTSITVHPKDKNQESIIKKILKALEIPFEKNEKPYNPEFVKKIQEREKSLNEGKHTQVGSKKELEDLLDSL